MKKLLTTCLLTAMLGGGAHAEVLFDFRNDAALYGALSGQSGPVTVTNSGVVATFTASDGTMNRTGSGFGINSVSLGSDDTDAFDIGEWIDITFATAVALSNVTVSSWNAGIDQAVIYVDGVSNSVITSGASHNFDISVPTGQVLRISSTAGNFNNGWSLDSLTVEPDEPLGNLAPVLGPIGDKSVILSNSLSFAVSATDGNGDEIILSAVDLPPGAVFNTVTNAGTVTNIFSWTAAAPVGVYTTTFYAADGTTNDSETITITVGTLPDSLVFDFREDAALWNALDNQTGPITYTNSGLAATFTASVSEMNRTTTGFGINDTSTTSDDTDALDVGEWIDISFDTTITLTNISVSSWNTNGTDQGTIYVNSVSNGVITSSGDNPFNMIVPAGEELRIASTGGDYGNGWSLDSLAVRIGTNLPVTVVSPLLALNTDGAQPTLYWDALDGLSYTVLWTPSLLEPFQPVATNDAPTDSWTDTVNTTNNSAFYQLEVERIEN
jgi:hypothetical protein